MDGTWDLTDARAALDAGIGMIAAGTYTAAIYFAGGSSGAYLMGFTTAADDPGNRARPYGTR